MVIFGGQPLSALDSALWGLHRSSAEMESSAQQVALAGTRSLDPVTLPDTALRTLESAPQPGMQDGLMGLSSARSLYTANASVVELLAGLGRDLIGIA